jgi:hypothetical protein
VSFRFDPCCDRCGAQVDDYGVVTQDYAYCSDCEDEYQAAQRVRYPYGQCPQCGAEYVAETCSAGKVHVVARHVEGACSNWRDYADYEPAPGGCYYGCRGTEVGTEPDWSSLPF